MSSKFSLPCHYLGLLQIQREHLRDVVKTLPEVLQFWVRPRWLDIDEVDFLQAYCTYCIRGSLFQAFTVSAHLTQGLEEATVEDYDKAKNNRGHRPVILSKALVGESAFGPRGPITPALNSGFRGMKWLAVFLLPLGGNPVHRRVTPQH